MIRTILVTLLAVTALSAPAPPTGTRPITASTTATEAASTGRRRGPLEIRSGRRRPGFCDEVDVTGRCERTIVVPPGGAPPEGGAWASSGASEPTRSSGQV